jgi:hypothetical protein
MAAMPLRRVARRGVEAGGVVCCGGYRVVERGGRRRVEGQGES